MKTKFIRTLDYDRFRFFNTNRNIVESHVRKLMASISEIGLLEEITINEDYYIIDGQHRFEALKRMSEHIVAKIKIGASSDSIIPVNIVRRGWSIMDYITHYSEAGNQDYIHIREVIQNNDSKLSTGTLLDLYSDSTFTSSAKGIREGVFKINLDKGAMLKEMIIGLEPFIPMYSQTTKFARAFSKVVKGNENFDIKRFKSQLQKYKLMIYPNSDDTARSIVELYNRRLGEKNRIF
jgi:hypothetical protein